MTPQTARVLRRVRLFALAGAFALFVGLLLQLRNPHFPRWISRGFFFAIDPLILLQHLVSARELLWYSFAAVVPLVLTLALGRFFCGWLCPFGAIHEFISWIAGARAEENGVSDRRRFAIKYLILAAMFMAAVAGTTLVGWLDPFSLLTRSISVSVEPAVARAVSRTVAIGRVSVEPVLVGAILLLIVGLNFWKRRLFCNTLCPLGALYGVLARFSLLRFEAKAECTECGSCAKRCLYEGGVCKGSLNSECDLCLGCIEDCPVGCVSIEFRSPLRQKPPVLSVGRRKLLGSAAVGFAAAAFARSGLQTSPRTKAGHGFLRPPGAVTESLFLSRCIRCGQCIESCPTGFIQPAMLEAGFDGIWTPVLNAQAGYCDYECTLCTKACPTGAIATLSREQKKAFKMGTAVIDMDRCLTYSDGANCTVCVDKCPVPAKPLRFRSDVAREASSLNMPIRRVSVVPDLCTGCSICEHFCPRGGAPGIVVSSEDEDREALRM